MLITYNSVMGAQVDKPILLHQTQIVEGRSNQRHSPSETLGTPPQSTLFYCTFNLDKDNKLSSGTKP